VQVPYEQRPGTHFAEGQGDGFHVHQDVTKRNGTTERRWVGTIGTANGQRIYQFKGLRLATMSFRWYGVRCVSLGTQEWQNVSRLADRIELVDAEMGLVWVVPVDIATRHGQLVTTKNGARFVIDLRCWTAFDREWRPIHAATIN
jgi:hypothetical protein